MKGTNHGIGKEDIWDYTACAVIFLPDSFGDATAKDSQNLGVDTIITYLLETRLHCQRATVLFGAKSPSLKFRLSKTMKTQIVVLLLTGLFAAVSPRVAAAEEALSVRLRDGRVQEHVNGSLRRSYGSGLIAVATDGILVAAVTKDGRIQEWMNGSMRRSYGSKVMGVSVSGGKVVAQLENGRTAEYVNGSLKRTF